jgi:hypothetical protein
MLTIHVHVSDEQGQLVPMPTFDTAALITTDVTNAAAAIIDDSTSEELVQFMHRYT